MLNLIKVSFFSIELLIFVVKTHEDGLTENFARKYSNYTIMMTFFRYYLKYNMVHLWSLIFGHPVYFISIRGEAQVAKLVST